MLKLLSCINSACYGCSVGAEMMKQLSNCLPTVIKMNMIMKQTSNTSAVIFLVPSQKDQTNGSQEYFLHQIVRIFSCSSSLYSLHLSPNSQLGNENFCYNSHTTNVIDLKVHHFNFCAKRISNRIKILETQFLNSLIQF